MSSNFYFTYASCPTAKSSLALPAIHTLRSYLEGCHWFPARQTQHQVRGCISTHPLPNLNFTLATAGCWLTMAGPTPRLCHNPDTVCGCPEWHRVPSPPLAWPLPGHLVPLEQVPVTRHTRRPSCLPDRPPLRPSEWLHSSHFHLLTSLSPTVTYLLPKNSPVGHASASMTRLFGIMMRSSWGSNASDAQNKWCALRQIVPLPAQDEDKQECQGIAEAGNKSLCLVCSEQTVEEQ